MKKNLGIRICLLILFLVNITEASLFAQPDSQTVRELMDQCKSDELISKFAPDVELCVFQTKEYIGAKAAAAALNSFLKSNPCKRFTVIHQGADLKKLKKEFLIGTLHTANGEFRVTFFIRDGQILEIDINHSDK